MIQPPRDYVHKKISDLLKHKYTVYKSRCHLKAAAAELFHRHKANQTLHAKGKHTATSLGLGRGDPDPWQQLLVPAHAPGKGGVVSRGETRPYLHATFLHATRGAGERSGNGIRP